MENRFNPILVNDRLAALKAVLSTIKDGLNIAAMEEIANANSVGAIWCIIFRSNNIEFYRQVIILSKIHPAADEMNELQPTDDVNAWLQLTKRNIWIPVLEELLEIGIYPTAEAFSLGDRKYNMNAVACLSCSDKRIHLLEKLLDKVQGFWVEAFSVCNINNKNAVAWLSASDKRIHVLDKVLDKGLDFKAEAFFIPDKYNQTAVDFLRKSKYPNASNMLDRIYKMQQLSEQLNLDTPNSFITLFSREDVLNFYGYIYLLNLMTARRDYPEEIWVYIGLHVLPASVRIEKIRELLRFDNRIAFIKYHMINSLENISIIHFHKKRADDLKTAIREENDPRETIRKQAWMSRIPGVSFYEHSSRVHQEPFQNKLENEYFGGSFDMILRDGCSLSKFNG